MRKLLTYALMSAFTALAAKDAVWDAPSVEAGTMPPAKYVIDYYGPSTDWFPEAPNHAYNMNTRIPDLTWLKYENSYALALRIRPITEAQLKKLIEVGIIRTRTPEKLLTFDKELETKRPQNRRIRVDVGIPGNDFTEFCFKMKTNSKNPAPVLVNAEGLGVIDTSKHEDKSVVCKDGFKAYKIPLTPSPNAHLKAISITLPANAKYDPAEEYMFFDLHLKRKEAKPRFTDIAQRQWIRSSAFEGDKIPTIKDGIADVVGYVNSKPADLESFDLNMKNYELRPQTGKEKDDGFKVEYCKEKINGKEMDAMRITLENGSRCYLKFPVKLFDATKFNTMTFYTKIDLPAGLPEKSLYNGDLPNLYGTNAYELNRKFDTFSFGIFSATRDTTDWQKSGVSQADAAYHTERNVKLPGNWRAVAFDFLNSDPSGSKTTFLKEVTHWAFYYNNRKIPEGKKVVVTIAAPKMTKGLMHAGGDMKLYKQFLAQRDEKVYQKKEKSLFSEKFPDSSHYLGAPEENRLDTPIPFIVNYECQAEIIAPRGRSGDRAFRGIWERAVDNMNDLLKNKYGMTSDIKVLRNPSKNDNVKIFLGNDHFKGVDKAQYEKDMKELAGSPGCAIRTRGKNIYIYGGNFNYAGDARGIANGIYLLMENNTDEIMVLNRAPTAGRWDNVEYRVFSFDKTGNMNLVWGKDYFHKPPMKYWSVAGGNNFNDRNFTAPGSWHRGEAIYGGRRNHTTNHWWGYGTENADGSRKPNDRWGLGENGKRMVPGCYSGHPCLINVIEHAKEAYLKKAYVKVPEKNYSYTWQVQDEFGLWVEDTLKVCVCDKCMTPIRLANGSVVKPSEPEFRGTQFFSNACAMIHAVNVLARRDIKIESIGYFWMSLIPLFEVSRNYQIRFCPYIRKNYFVPIYAPQNDIFWRDYNRWCQLNVEVGLYEYFLGVHTRPWVDYFQFDFPEEIKRGLTFATPECSSNQLMNVELWTLLRYFWDPSKDPRELRRYYLRRTYHEAAPDMENFYFTLHNFIHKHVAPYLPLEFEDNQIVGVQAWLTESEKGGMSVAEELNSYIEDAKKNVKNPASAAVLKSMVADWEGYINNAKKRADAIKETAHKYK